MHNHLGAHRPTSPPQPPAAAAPEHHRDDPEQGIVATTTTDTQQQQQQQQSPLDQDEKEDPKSEAVRVPDESTTTSPSSTAWYSPSRLRALLLAPALSSTSQTPLETRGVQPIPLAQRTSTVYSSYFSIWACMNVNLLPLTFGMLGPSIYSLPLLPSSLTILFFCLLTASVPAYLGTLGCRTGLRQMVQARYSFGRWGVVVPVLLNLATMTGFCVIICVVGGQCLSASSEGGLSPVLGIVVVGLLSLGISFCGYGVLHAYERFAWVPALLAIVVTAGVGGSELWRQQGQEVVVEMTMQETAKAVLSYGMVIASYMIPYACLASDFTTYLDPKIPSARLFLYGYAGLLLPTVPLLVLGAAIGGAMANVPSWSEGYDSNIVGGVLAAMLAPAGGFGQFVVVVLAFTMLGNIAATMYSITLNFQMLVPQLAVKVPRYVYSVVITAIVIPVSIRAAADFFLSLENFIALIAYWSAAFVTVLLVEHVVFRGADCAAYDADAWNDAARLPWGAAALAAGVCSFGMVVPCMAQVWYTGPIAEKTGDIGFEMAVAVTAVLYVPFRLVEKRLSGR